MCPPPRGGQPLRHRRDVCSKNASRSKRGNVLIQRKRRLLPVALVDPVEGRLRHEDLVRPEHVRDRDLVLEAELAVGQVGSRLLEGRIFLIVDEHRLRVGVQAQTAEHGHDVLRLRLSKFPRNAINNGHSRSLVLNRNTDGELRLLAVHLLVRPVLGLRAEGDATSNF